MDIIVAETEIVYAVKQAEEAVPVREVARKYRVSKKASGAFAWNSSTREQAHILQSGLG